MPNWNIDYENSLKEKFSKIHAGLENRIDSVVNGRVAPAINDITIGSGRKFSGAILFFDICGFTNRTNSSDINKLKETLIILDCVIPMVMNIIYDFDGYVEKNTGDGVMAIIGLEANEKTACQNAVSVATTIFFALKDIINPYLETLGIAKVDARIGIDHGEIIVARLGLPNGKSQYDRNFLTAVGPSANIASKIQHQAGTNQIFIGNSIYNSVEEYRKKMCNDKTPSDWMWIYKNSKQPYRIYHYTGVRKTN
jgi:class 3 adenylate cyclase